VGCATTQVSQEKVDEKVMPEEITEENLGSFLDRNHIPDRHLRVAAVEMFETIRTYKPPEKGEKIDGKQEDRICRKARLVFDLYKRALLNSFLRHYGRALLPLPPDYLEASPEIRPIIRKLFEVAHVKLSWIPQQEEGVPEWLLKAYEATSEKYDQLKSDKPIIQASIELD
jgi:hypothetical protein